MPNTRQRQYRDSELDTQAEFAYQVWNGVWVGGRGTVGIDESRRAEGVRDNRGGEKGVGRYGWLWTGGWTGCEMGRNSRRL